jgi:hypothetical protein
MFTNISTTSYTNFNIPFTSPSISNEFYIQLNGVVGNLLARNWAVISGTSVNTQVKGNLNVPYGIITTSDLFYGPSTLSLTTALSNLSNVANTSPSGLPISTATQTALNDKLNKADPTYTGMLSNVNSNFQVASTGIVNCLDVKYNGGTSLTIALSKLSNVANTAPSGLPISTATQSALDTQYSNLSFGISQKVSNVNPAFIGILAGNAGFQIDNSNNILTNGAIIAGGQIVGQTPVCVAFYGTPTCFNTAGTQQTSPVSGTAQTYNIVFTYN